MSKFLNTLKQKIEDAQHRLDVLESKNTHTIAFKSDFNAAVNSMEAIRECLVKFQPIDKKFGQWRLRKIKEIRNDNLLASIRTWRVKYFHSNNGEEIIENVGSRMNNLGSITAENGSVTLGSEGPTVL